MEKKTMGSFLAALRKANGMTQKDLAEMLNVSDKAVSRWERDENAPDLSLIPVIAEIFGITADELLRGERKSASEAGEGAGVSEKTSAKAEKQIRHLIKDCRTKFHIRSMIAVGIAFAGLLAAMICNFAFLRANLGFFIGCVFYAAAILCEGIFYRLAADSVTDTEISEELVNDCRRQLFQKAERVFSMIAVVFVFTLPLILLLQDAYVGIELYTWLAFGILFAAAAGLICILCCWRANEYAVKHHIYWRSEAEQVRMTYVWRIRRKTVAIVCLIFMVLLLAQVAFNSIFESADFCEGHKFDNYTEFAAFMAMESAESDINRDNAYVDVEVAVEGEEEEEKGEDDFDLEQLISKDGTILCEYVFNNMDVVEIRYGEEENGYLPIEVYTEQDLASGIAVMDWINAAFILVYIAELVAAIGIYRRKISSI